MGLISGAGLTENKRAASGFATSARYGNYDVARVDGAEAVGVILPAAFDRLAVAASKLAICSGTV